MAGKMFPFITATWNPIGGECKHKCTYCWATKLAEKYQMNKYKGEPLLYETELKKVFSNNDFVFVGDMTDIFGEWVPSRMIQRVIDRIWEYKHAGKETQFLFLTKNPRRYYEFFFPNTVILGATIESDSDPSLIGVRVSDAPNTMERVRCMKGLIENRRFISVEPIIEFSPGGFIENISKISPEFIAVGFDNYGHRLPEPESLAKVEELISGVEEAGIKVYRKTIREPVPEEQQAWIQEKRIALNLSLTQHQTKNGAK